MARRFQVEVPIAAPPDAVRAWWTDVSDFESADPKARPFRLVTLERRADGSRVLESHWRMMGRVVRMREVFFVAADGSWGFDTTGPFGIDVADRFSVAPAPGGSVLRVSCALSGRDLVGRLVLPFYVSSARRQFTRQWREAAARCERDLA